MWLCGGVPFFKRVRTSYAQYLCPFFYSLTFLLIEAASSSATRACVCSKFSSQCTQCTVHSELVFHSWHHPFYLCHQHRFIGWLYRCSYLQIYWRRQMPVLTFTTYCFFTSFNTQDISPLHDHWPPLYNVCLLFAKRHDCRRCDPREF